MTAQFGLGVSENSVPKTRLMFEKVTLFPLSQATVLNKGAEDWLMFVFGKVSSAGESEITPGVPL